MSIERSRVLLIGVVMISMVVGSPVFMCCSLVVLAWDHVVAYMSCTGKHMFCMLTVSWLSAVAGCGEHALIDLCYRRRVATLYSACLVGVWVLVCESVRDVGRGVGVCVWCYRRLRWFRCLWMSSRGIVVLCSFLHRV